MKHTMKKVLALALVLILVSAMILPVSAAGGPYSITISNPAGTGITISGQTFHAFRIMDADSLTSYAVDPHFEDYFTGTLTGGNGIDFNFTSLKADIATAEAMAPGDAKDHALSQAKQAYNAAASSYLDSYQGNMYPLAIAMRTYLDGHTDYNDHDACDGYSTVPGNAESTTISGLLAGYYFVVDSDSARPGLGVAASGAFVPLGENTLQHPTLEVKNSTPTVDKKILHNDKDGAVNTPDGSQNGLWDMVGDYEIGDTTYFKVSSTLPSNIDEYRTYTYRLIDDMDDGVSYNRDATIYLDEECTQELNGAYYTVNNEPGEHTFVIDVDLKAMQETSGLWIPAEVDSNGMEVRDGSWIMPKLYTHYTGEVTSIANVSTEYEKNKITLEFSNNPHDNQSFDKAEDEVYQYTFKLDVHKLDEKNESLAGAEFALYKNDKKIPLSFKETIEGVDYYYPNKNETGSGTMTTTESGKFVILGLDDQVTYCLKEVKAPEGYNPIDDIYFTITAQYGDIGNLTGLSTSSPAISPNGDNSGFHTSIVNRPVVYLPSTGGMGTMIFQIGGIVLMLAAATMLFMYQRKKTRKQ